MNVQPGEKLLIVKDEPLAYVRDTLLAEAVTVEPAELWSYTFSNSTRPLTGLPNPLLHLPEQKCVIREMQSKMAEVARLREMAKRQQAAIDALPGTLLHEVFGGFERDSG